MIPIGANLFSVSDSFTLPLTTTPAQGMGQYASDGAGGHILYYQPGPANQSGIIQPGALVQVAILHCALYVQPIAAEQLQGINTDLVVGLYNISQPGNPWTTRMPFAPPYGIASNGILMNQVSKLSNASQRAVRYFGSEAPLIFGQRAPSTGNYQVGAAFQFNFGVSPILVEYEYEVHGYWTAT